jgi:hypothetical protein
MADPIEAADNCPIDTGRTPARPASLADIQTVLPSQSNEHLLSSWDISFC